MPDTVTSEYVYSGRRRKLLHLTGDSDGSGESAITKADISTLTFAGNLVPTYTVVDMIEYSIQGFASILLTWDHTTPDEIALLAAGQGCIDFSGYGGKVDPRTEGGTGDIKLTSNGAADGASYDILIHFRPKS